MAYGRARKSTNYGEFWPGYVDVLSTLLLVVTFLMSIFMVAQYYVSQEATGKDTMLRRLTRQIAEMTNLLSLEKGKGKSLEDELANLQASLATLRNENERLGGMVAVGNEREARITALVKELADKTSLSNEAAAKVDLLNQQLLALRRQMAALQEALGAAEAKDKESQARISDLGARLNLVLARQVQELQRYRSDFFGRLRELLRDRKDIRVVGDRFVFQSEVLFPSGQATMTAEGLAAIDQLASAIIELERAIPSEIDWALQVDGHTDSRPIASTQFPSNWELSSARATSVVKYLISRGVSPKRLVAAGFGEFQPLEEGASDEVLRRNRRIELKLTNR
ncbi:MAG TPA: peptidoglycan -binding protein [Hyphomicrobiaceae bacterium]|jgi:chemotaxis protein MotB|nr:peptidoglycan -binding protein [Hyphomicrobiaceae bacterium]